MKLLFSEVWFLVISSGKLLGIYSIATSYGKLLSTEKLSSSSVYTLAITNPKIISSISSGSVWGIKQVDK